MKKKVFLTFLGVIGLAFYLTLCLIVAPYIKNGGLLLMLIKPYKPFLQYEWVGKTSINCMIFFAVAYAITVFIIWLRGRAVRAGEEYGSMKWLTAKELRVLDNGKAVFFIRGEYPVLDDKYNLKQHPLYGQLGESTGKFYDHGEAKNKLIFEKGKEYKPAGRKIDVKVSGGENLKYLTDEEIDSYCP